MRKPRALRPGDRIAVVAPASAFARAEFDAGVNELKTLGFEPVYDAERVRAARLRRRARRATRAAAFERAWRDPDIAALIAVRGGYGSVHLLPLLDLSLLAGHAEGVHRLQRQHLAPVLADPYRPHRLVPRADARGTTRARSRRVRSRHVQAMPVPAVSCSTKSRTRRSKSCIPAKRPGCSIGGTLTQLCASLGTPMPSIRPAAACSLSTRSASGRIARPDADAAVSERHPLARVSALVFGELPRCDEPDGSPTAREVVEELTSGFRGPILYGLPSGHTDGPTLTLPFGVRARVLTTPRPVSHHRRSRRRRFGV